MTAKLQDLMHEQADTRVFDLPDVDRLVALGATRVRRRRLALLGGCPAAAVLVAAVAIGTAGEASPRPDVATEGSVEPGPPAVSYALGSVIHDGETTVDIGRPVASYVRTEVGYVSTDPAGAVWSSIGGVVEQVGATDPRDSRLVAEATSSLVGWVDTRGEDPTYVVLDQGDGSRQALDVDTAGMGVLADEEDPAFLYALDDTTAYLRDSTGAVAVDLDTGDIRPIDPGARNGFDVVTARDGVVAFTTSSGVAIGPTRSQATVEADTDGGEPGSFSPDGAFLTLDAERVTVIDTTDGTPVPFGLDGFSVGYGWVDSETLSVFSVPADGDIRLLECTVPGADCEVLVDDLGAFDDVEGTFALPGGTDFVE